MVTDTVDRQGHKQTEMQAEIRMVLDAGSTNGQSVLPCFKYSLDADRPCPPLCHWASPAQALALTLSPHPILPPPFLMLYQA